MIDQTYERLQVMCITPTSSKYHSTGFWRCDDFIWLQIRHKHCEVVTPRLYGSYPVDLWPVVEPVNHCVVLQRIFPATLVIHLDAVGLMIGSCAHIVI